MPTTRDLELELDQRLQRYAASGMSRAGMLAQLTLAGYPTELLRSRFPEMSDVAFGITRPTANTKPQGRAPAPGIGTQPTRSPLPTGNAGRFPQPPKAGPKGEAQDGPSKPAQDAPSSAGASRSAALRGPSAPDSVSPRNPPIAARKTGTELAHAEEGISFHYVPLIQCSFPHADPGQAHSFTRKNGWLELTLGTTRPETGLPYGVPARLLTIYAASEAVRTKSPEIYLGHSVHDFLRRLDVPITRGDRGSLRVYANQLLKLIHCTLTIDENIRDSSGRTGLHIRQALFAEEARLWWDDDTRGVGQGSSLVLSSVLFHSILDRSAPLSTHAIKQLRKSPMDLDVYAWLVHRLFSLSKPSTVTWQQLSEQFGHGYAEIRKFRRFFIDSLKRVQTVYPEAKIKVADSGVILLPSKPHLAPTSVAVSRR